MESANDDATSSPREFVVGWERNYHTFVANLRVVISSYLHALEPQVRTLQTSPNIQTQFIEFSEFRIRLISLARMLSPATLLLGIAVVGLIEPMMLITSL